jgi:hypothetical protein
MKKLLLILSVTLLQGCAVALSSYIPSFWDDNQSHKIISVRLDIDRLDCKTQQRPQVAKLRDDLHWFRLYSESKGSRQTDVLRLTEPMEQTIEDWYKRVSAEGYKDNPIYCEMKKKVVSEQAARAAKAVLGRF